MDITQLIILVTNAAAESTVGNLWALLERRMGQKPAAQEALQDLKQAPHDPDLQTVLKVQLVKLLREDPAFAGELAALLQETQGTILALGSATVAAGDHNQAVGAGGVILGDHSTGNLINTGTINFKGNIYQGKPTRDPVAIKKIYCEMLVKATGHVYLQGLMPGTGTPESSQRSVALAHVYIDLDVDMLGEGRARSKEEVPDWMQDLGQKDKEQNTALKALLDNPKMVLLGDPGSGKSTFIRFITHCLAQHQLDPQAGWLKRLAGWPAAWSDQIPLVVILRDFAARLPKKLPEPQVCHLLDFIKSRLKDQNLTFSAPFLERQLEQGRALVLLDGLDEVPDPRQRGFILGAVRAFIEHYSKNLYLVTCRVLSYQPPHKKTAPDLRLTELPAFTLAPFSKEKTDRFIDAWYTEIGLPEKAAGLKLALQKPHTQLAALASNPLLLTEMAVAHVYLGELPDERVKLYDAVVDLLLYRWDDQKFGGKQDAVGLMQLLKDAGQREFDLKLAIAQLALEAHAGSNGGEQKLADIADGKLLRKLESLSEKDGLAWAGKVVDLIQKRAGLLIEREPGVYTFPHRTFQEYMAGIALARAKDFIPQVKAKAALGEPWRLVIILACGFMDQIDHQLEKVLSLVDELCPEDRCGSESGWRNAWLAGDILLEVGLKRSGTLHLGKTVTRRVAHCLKHLLETGSLSPLERARAGDTLARLGDPRFDPGCYFLPKEDLLGFVPIPAGEFSMGSNPKVDEDTRGNEEPQHKVTLPEYYIARYPVTVAQFTVFVDQTSYDRVDPIYRNDPPSRPVRYVSWHDAIAYCNWLDQTLRAQPNLPIELRSKLDQGWKITLPTEAEWEKVARGADGRIYAWGNEFDAGKANVGESRIGDTSVVGCFLAGASPYGILDMGGNVWEWTHSQYKPYPYTPRDGREELQSNNSRALRGGAFLNYRGGARCAFRYYLVPDARLSYLGFRVVLVSPISHI